ncbi:MAG: 4Fe-4S dicluster domain-containing protein, partial [Chloroflexi bacterium]|nr:4Fe-4S dicluster domain-containing protein [Chloroflexota bacterium]
DVGFIDMKPLAGGMITNAKIAFKYLFQFPDVAPIPGIEKLHEIDEIVQILNGPLELTGEEQQEMQQLKQQLGARFCHRCDYCQPCKEGIAISTVMTYPSLVRRLPPQHIYSSFWSILMEKAAACTQCGECEERCPYHLPIHDMIAEHYNQYEKDKSNYQKSTQST